MISISFWAVCPKMPLKSQSVEPAAFEAQRRELLFVIVNVPVRYSVAKPL